MKRHSYFTIAAAARLELIRMQLDADYYRGARLAELDEDIRSMQGLAIRHGFEWDTAYSAEEQGSLACRLAGRSACGLTTAPS
jgi:hypothetical protein